MKKLTAVQAWLWRKLLQCGPDGMRCTASAAEGDPSPDGHCGGPCLGSSVPWFSPTEPLQHHKLLLKLQNSVISPHPVISMYQKPWDWELTLASPACFLALLFATMPYLQHPPTNTLVLRAELRHLDSLARSPRHDSAQKKHWLGHTCPWAWTPHCILCGSSSALF